MSYPTRVVIITTLPGQGLNPNGDRPFWRETNEARNQLRTDTFQSVLDSCGPSPDPVQFGSVQVELRSLLPSDPQAKGDDYYRPIDPGNLAYACKPLFDGLKDGGLLVDDTFAHMRLEPPTWRQAHAYRDEGLAVRVTELWHAPTGDHFTCGCGFFGRSPAGIGQHIRKQNAQLDRGPAWGR